jgi:hypothetical protein
MYFDVALYREHVNVPRMHIESTGAGRSRLHEVRAKSVRRRRLAPVRECMRVK